MAITQRPDWVIENARPRAEEIMNAGKATAYYHAIEWLSEARAAYRALDRHSEWSAYRTKLMDSWAQVQVDGDAEAAGFELIGSFRHSEI